jgi:Domain of unknown function (DUF4178)
MFNFFNKDKKKDKKPELHYDPTNIKVSDVRRGFLLDYDLRTWEVTDEFEYDWGDNFFTYEYKLVSGTDTLYMHIEEADQVYCAFTVKLPFVKLGDAVAAALRSSGQPPAKILHEGVEYFRDKESVGFFRSTADEDSVEMTMWEYYDETGNQTLIIFQWDVDDFEASIGIIETDRAVSNILPRDESEMH